MKTYKSLNLDFNFSLQLSFDILINRVEPRTVRSIQSIFPTDRFEDAKIIISKLIKPLVKEREYILERGS